MTTDRKELFLKLSWFIGRMNEVSIETTIDLETGKSVQKKVSQPLHPFTQEEYDGLHILLVDTIDTLLPEELQMAKEGGL